MQFGGAGKHVTVLHQCGIHIGGEELIHLPGSAPDEDSGISEQAHATTDCHLGEVGILAEPIQQVVGAVTFLHALAGFLRMNPDLLVADLAIRPVPLHHLHDHLFGGQERQFGSQVPLDDFGVDHCPLEDVLHDDQNGVDRQESLRQVDPATRAVVERALEELSRLRHERIERQDHGVARERIGSLGPHRVSLVSHCAGADLALLERLLDLLEHLENAQVETDLMDAGGQPAERREDHGVDLARVGLPGHHEPLRETEGGRDQVVEPLHLCLVPLEQLEERVLGASGTLGAEEEDLGDQLLDRLQIQQQVLNPHCSPLADSSRLGRLQMRPAQRRQFTVLQSELPHPVDHSSERNAGHAQRVTQDHQVGVVGHIATGGTEVDDRLGQRTDRAEGLYVRHHVVPLLSLEGSGGRVVDVTQMGLHLGELRAGDREPELLLGACELQPELAPEIELVVVAKQLLHGIRRVAADERISPPFGGTFGCSHVALLEGLLRSCTRSRSSPHPPYQNILLLSN